MATTKVTQPVIDLNGVAAATDVSALKMPAGGAFSGSPAEAMMRCDTSQTSQGSDSSMQHYTGNNEWKNFVNLPEEFEYLVVAGGGGSGSSGGRSGGGGAGGLLTNYGGVKLSLTRGTAINFQVGGGGTAGGSNSQGGNGTDSYLNLSAIGLSDITASGGGGGGGSASGSTANGRSGGSGGGGATTTGTSSGGAGTIGQGNNGGTGVYADPRYGGGGGGGAGAVGANGNTSGSGVGGAGGIGSIVNILPAANIGSGGAQVQVGEVSGSDVYYSGGGGGGSTGTDGVGGLGGGGDGGTGSLTQEAGAANSGGGGGGAGSGIAGGSGVIILRYPSSVTCAVSAGEATNSPFTEGTDKVTVITGTGTGTVTFS